MRARPCSASLEDAAATRFRRKLIDDGGGRIPQSLCGLRRLAKSYEIVCGPLQCCPESFTGKLFYDEEHSLWIIGYNPRLSHRQKRKIIIHELAEFLAVNDFPSLFDDLPGVRDGYGNYRVYHYDGGGNPDDLRHRIARCVERLCFRW